MHRDFPLLYVLKKTIGYNSEILEKQIAHIGN